MTPKPTTTQIMRATVLPALLGLVAGIVGGFSAFVQLQNETFDTAPVPARRPQAAVTAPLPETDIAALLDTIDIPVFAASAANRLAAAESGTLDLAAAIGYATVLTSDGWLVSSRALSGGDVLLGVNGRLLEPKAAIADPATGLVFLKVDASSLQVIGFEATESLRVGTALFAKENGKFMSSRFAGAARFATDPAGLRDDSEFPLGYHLARPVSDQGAGGAVLTIGGNLAGIALRDDRFVPTHHFASVLEDAFRQEAPERGSLGLRYVDLSSVVREAGQVASSGALVTSVTGAAARGAGVVKGDVIIRVGESDILNGRDLAETLMGLRPGDRVRLEVMRGGERQSLDAVLQ